MLFRDVHRTVQKRQPCLYRGDIRAVREIRRLPKFRPDKERQNAAHGNFVWTVNGNMPFVEIPLGRLTAFRRSQEFHLDKQRHSAVRGNFILTSNGGLPIVKIPSG